MNPFCSAQHESFYSTSSRNVRFSGCSMQIVFLPCHRLRTLQNVSYHIQIGQHVNDLTPILWGGGGGVTVKKTAQPLTTVQDCVLTSVKPADILCVGPTSQHQWARDNLQLCQWWWTTDTFDGRSEHVQLQQPRLWRPKQVFQDKTWPNL